MKYLLITFITFIIFLKGSVSADAATNQTQAANSCDSIGCNENQLCMTNSTGDAGCYCKFGWSGSQCDKFYPCDERRASMCNPRAGNTCGIIKGIHVCICNKRWSGNRCNKRIMKHTYGPEKGPRTACSSYGTKKQTEGGCICKSRYRGRNCNIRRKKPLKSSKRKKGCDKKCPSKKERCIIISSVPTCVLQTNKRS